MPTSRPLARTALSLLLAAVLASPAFAAEPAWVTKSNENAKVLLNVLAKYSPESASSLGVDGYDEQITDMSRDQFEANNKDLRAAIAELQKRMRGESDSKVKQDLQILIDKAQDNLQTSALQRKYFMPFDDLTGMIFGVVRGTLDPRIPKARQQALLVRLDKYAGLAKGYRPVTELAHERLQERLKANKNLLGPYKGEIEQALNDGPTLLKGMRELLAKSELTGWESRFDALEKQLTAYNARLKAEMLPKARSDHKLPPEVYADNLKNFGVDIGPQEMIAKALTSFAEIRNQMQITANLIAKERGLKDADYRAVMLALKKEQIPTDKVMPLYAERLAALEAAVREQRVVTLPTRKAVIRLATMAENAASPAPHMSPPRLIGNTGEYGEFVLTTGMPPDASGKRLVFDDFTHQSGTWSITAHEARPGHELQFAKMIETGVSTARAVFAFNSVNVEGWALYAEAEMQPYEPLDGQLFALQARAMRAARAFLDPMVNLGEITPDGVKTFLMRDVGLSEGMATQEMQHYTFRAPGQATSYFYGYQRLMETRQAAEVALRGKFDRQKFNDFVLAQGLVPPKLLRKAVLEEFVPAQGK
ncbi:MULTISPECIES: DUF885 domain-containing protein [unclassified Massilia]|uniref:DUF885 domain-containing protein n=1 Tax=unclassified Massilia TaxID=2609279 RepID=UPI001786D49D|nr:MULTISPECIES: DUF885 domain-containing protein [unclassified Massilia]MBD8530682.1 DUF885 domain-containing protein [Massilia sp. CFBP 13647]MBD8674907.1 DUF885 domain-containing protein [Massilia sp. CFBP 13721]